MNFDEAQQDMRHAYLGGGPGLLASGAVWIAAGAAGSLVSKPASVGFLVVGGMMIHPAAIGLSKLFGRPGRHARGNPLARLALESTFLMFIGLFVAFAVMQVKPAFFFPVTLAVIGGRYLVFATLYGTRLYWGIGGALAVAGMLCLVLNAPFTAGAYLGGAIELVAALMILSNPAFAGKST
ncbi:MAG: hypothetical protein AAGK09_07815 [Planctomycetota bacterium]